MSDDRNTIYEMQKEINTLHTAMNLVVIILTTYFVDTHVEKEEKTQTVKENLTKLHNMEYYGW